MDTILEHLTEIMAGNRFVELVFLIIVLGFLFILARIIRKILNRFSLLRKEENSLVHASFLEAVAGSITFLMLSTGIYVGINFIELSVKSTQIITTSATVLMVISVGFFILKLVDVPSIWFESLMEKNEKGMNKMFLPVIRNTLRVVVISFIIIQIIQVVSDKPITTIIAGLGIGGLAVALAAQDTLKHFIGSFVLAGDRPFEIGDRVVIDGHDGPIESIGMRSTRIRTLDGHIVTIPNGEMANKTIQNVGKRPYIKRVANITITYDTHPEKVKRAVDILKEILENHEGMDPEFPPRVFFNEFNADSLNIRVLYWYHPPDYWQYMEFTQRINHEIFQRFNEEGIDFAFPTQTLYVAGDPKRPLNVGWNREH